MAINLVHVSDIHFGSGESHGVPNPETGLNIRFEDFVQALVKVVDHAIGNEVDVFLFAGDAYKNAMPEPVYQEMFARQLKRLSDAHIPTILLVGNHDQILRGSSSHSMSVFQSLEIPGVLILDRPRLEIIDTRNGALQVIGIPYATRHHLATFEKYARLNPADFDQILVRHTEVVLADFYNRLDDSIPAVVTAHMTLDRAVAGIEQELLVGHTLTYPTDMFVDKRVDYVALGHVHKHQVIRQENPLIAYSGSLERVDFGEQKEDKGFILAKIERGRASYKFHSIEPRPFVTVDADLTASPSPTETLVQLIKSKCIPGCVLRVRYKISQAAAPDVDEARIRAESNGILKLKLQPEVVPDYTRARLPNIDESSTASPLKAVEAFLDETMPDRKEALLQRAKILIDRLESEE